MSESRRTPGTAAAIAAGVIIGAVESVLAIAFAAFVFGGLLVSRLPDGIGLYLVAAVLTLGILAWRGGSRGVVGSVQDAAAAVLGIIAGVVAAKVTQITQVAQATGLQGLRGARHLPHGDRRHADRDRSVRRRLLRGRALSARQPRAVRAVSGRRGVPRRYGMAPVQGRDLRRVERSSPRSPPRTT